MHSAHCCQFQWQSLFSLERFFKPLVHWCYSRWYSSYSSLVWSTKLLLLSHLSVMSFKFCVLFFDMPILHLLLSFHLTHSLGPGVFSYFVLFFSRELFNSRVINGSGLCTLVHLECGLAFELINISEQHLLWYSCEYC